MDVLFYKNLKEFLKELNSVFPDDDEMKVITSSINIYSMDDTEYKIIKKFYASIAPLESIVLSRDEKFFYMDHSNIFVFSFNIIMNYHFNFYELHIRHIPSSVGIHSFVFCDFFIGGSIVNCCTFALGLLRK